MNKYLKSSTHPIKKRKLGQRFECEKHGVPMTNLLIYFEALPKKY